MTTRHIAELKKIAEGREAEMFAWDDGKVLRLYRGDFLRSSVEFQVAALRAAGEAGAPVPSVYETIEIDGRLGVVMERIPGVDLLTLIGKKPWKVWWVGRVTGRAHAAIHAVTAPPGLPSIHARYRHRIETSDLVPPELVAPALAALETLPEARRLLHGDYHPGNVMMRDGEPVIIDWSNATRGAPEADFARTRLTLRLGDPPPGTGVVVRAAVFARKLLIDSYTASYRRIRPPDEDAVERWLLPVAVARLAEGIESERPKLLRFIDRRLT